MPERCSSYGRFRAGRTAATQTKGQQEEQDVRIDMKAEITHGGVSSSVRIKQAEVLRKNFQ
jgi:hypothetical protein